MSKVERDGSKYLHKESGKAWHKSLQDKAENALYSEHATSYVVANEEQLKMLLRRIEP